MSLFHKKFRIESIRKKGYDYSQCGSYFITICTLGKVCLLGRIADGNVVLNRYGKIVKNCWHDLPNHYQNVVLDEFVIMPDHVHGIIIIKNVGDNFTNTVETGPRPVSTDNQPKSPQFNHGLSEIVRAFKSFSARRINEMDQTTGLKIWQNGYYDHIIRDDIEYDRIKEYIRDNPKK
jgi:putative transposase